MNYIPKNPDIIRAFFYFPITLSPNFTIYGYISGYTGNISY